MAYQKSRGDAYSPIPFEYQVTLGQFPRYENRNKFGYNNNVGTSQEEIWNVGGVEAYLSTAETMNIASTSTDDDGDPAGTGAQTLIISGLDNNWVEIEEEVTLNGTSNVTTTNSFLRVLRLIVTAAGSTGSNVGTITATASSAGSVHAQINPTDNQTLKINFPIPAGKYGVITHSEIGCAKSDDCEIRFKVRPFGEVFQTKRLLNFFQNTVSFSNFIPILLPPKCDVTITALSGAGGVKVSANIDYVLIDSREITG